MVSVPGWVLVSDPDPNPELIQSEPLYWDGELPVLSAVHLQKNYQSALDSGSTGLCVLTTTSAIRPTSVHRPNTDASAWTLLSEQDCWFRVSLAFRGHYEMIKSRGVGTVPRPVFPRAADYTRVRQRHAPRWCLNSRAVDVPWNSRIRVCSWRREFESDSRSEVAGHPLSYFRSHSAVNGQYANE